MKNSTKDSFKKIILILAFIALSSTIVNAIAVGDGARGALLSINNFFSGQQYQPYAQTIDFFFFSFLFIAIYMMGARYAFKEVKRPEQVIVILLGLMTAFLLVLAGWSATILLPYIHWIFYILLFAFYYWLLKGIKSKFWRFILALLLTLLTIWLLSQLLGGFIAPDASGYISPFFESLKGIKFPELPGPPGIPSGISDLFSQPSAPPTGPSTLPPVPTPSEGGFFSFLKDWWWVIPLLFLAIWAIRRWVRRRGPQQPQDLSQIISKIDEFINKKQESITRIKGAFLRKIDLFRDATRVQAYLNAMSDEDVALLWTEEGRQRLRDEKRDFVDILEEEFKLIDGLKELRKVEVEIYRIFETWVPIISRAMPAFANLQAIVNSIRELIGKKVLPFNIGNLTQQGIIYLIELIFDVEKHDITLDKELEALLDEENIQSFIIDKFSLLNRERNRLADYLRSEGLLITELEQKIRQQIQRLDQLKQGLGGTPTTPTPPTPPTPPIPPTGPVAPPPTVHPDWPFPPQGKYDPNPPDKPVFPIKPVIPPPPKPKPSRHKEAFVDLSPMFLPIGNQNNSSACGAFAGASIAEYLLNPTEGRQDFENNLSELFLWYDIRPDKSHNMGIYGIDTIPFSLTKKGICFERLWEWNPLDAAGVPTKFAIVPNPQEIVYPDALKKKIVSSRVLDPNDPDSWVDELLNKNPILIGIEMDSGFDAAAAEKRLYDTINTRLGKYHVLVIVGFTSNYPSKQDPKIGVPAFKIRNSWGKFWGENGYLWITYDILPQLLRDIPIVMEGPIQQEPEGQKEVKLHTLILTPTNSTPKAPIEIIGTYHDGYGDNRNWIKIGKVERENKIMNEILLEGTSLNEKFQASICFFKYKDYEKTQEVNRFKIIKIEKSQVSVEINNKKIPGSAFINEKVKTLQINEYTFDVKLEIKEQDVMPRGQYMARFEDKILKLDKKPKPFKPEPPKRPLSSPGTVRIKATTSNGRNEWSGELELEISEPLAETSTGFLSVPTGLNNMTPGTYKIKYISGGPSANVKNPEQTKELKPGETVEFVFDFEVIEPEPQTRTEEQWAELSMEIFRDLNSKKNILLSSDEIIPYVENKYKVKLVPIGPKYKKWILAALLIEESIGFYIPCLNNYYWQKWEDLINKGTIKYLYNVDGYSNLNQFPSLDNFELLPKVQIIHTKVKRKVGAETEDAYVMGPPWKKGILSDQIAEEPIKPSPGPLRPAPTPAPSTPESDFQITTPSKDNQIIRINEEATFTAELKEESLPPEARYYIWILLTENDKPVAEIDRGKISGATITTKPIILKGFEPGDYKIIARLLNNTGKIIKTSNVRKIKLE